MGSPLGGAVVTIERQSARLGASVDDFARCVAALTRERFLQKLNGWSPRDILAHLIGWNRHVIEGSRQIRRGELPFYDVDPGQNYSKVNSALVREYSSTDLHDLLLELETSARELQDFLESLDPSEWARDYGVRHEGSSLTIQNTVDELIQDYAHHRAQIEEWTRRLAGQ
jgi:hypothetical protein